MRANHSPLQFFGLVAIACALAYGVWANVALAGTMASTTESNGALASLVGVGTNSASEAGPRSLADATRTTVNPDRTSRALRSVTTTTATTPGRSSSPTIGGPEGGSANPGQLLGQVTATAAPATAAPAAPARRSTRVDVGVAPLIGGRDSAGASTSGTAPSATTTNPAPPVGILRWRGRSLDDTLPRRSRTRRRYSRRRRPRQVPQGRRRPSHDRPRHRPSRRRRARRAPSRQDLSRQNLSRRSRSTLRQLQCPGATEGAGSIQLRTSVARWLRAGQDEPVRLVTLTDAQPLPAPSHQSRRLGTGRLGPAIGSLDVLAGDADLERGAESTAAHPPRSDKSPKSAPVVRTRAATSIPHVLPSVPPVQTRPPLGGAAAASGGAVGSVAPSVVAQFDALALVLATILLVRLSLDRPAWRSALLVSRLEHPG